MNSRERIDLSIRHREPDRVAIHDSPWFTTVRRWHKEGLPEGTDPAVYFRYEIAGVAADTSFRFPKETVEETEEYIIERNSQGALLRNWKNATSTPEMIGFTITSREAWEENKPRLAMARDRMDWDRDLEQNQKDCEAGMWCSYNAVIGYDRTQGIVGSENLLIAMKDDPEWVVDMFASGIELVIQCAEEMLAGGFHFDGAWIFDDMGYRNASLFSPQTYRELLFPQHKRLCDFLHARGLPVILHSCGCVRALVPQLIEAGFDCLQPLEVKAGMDLIELKKSFGDKLAFMGGIDVRKMSDPDPHQIEEEIRTKIPFAMKGGGYIYHSDHSVPDDVSFERYQRVIELVRKHGTYRSLDWEG
jgi:uroporphyrinogen decarboxylase